MTLPDERYRAVIQTRQFLQDLCSSKRTPRVPKAIRAYAYSMLRHYPNDSDMEEISWICPELFCKEMEPLHRMVVKYRQDNNIE
jgi:hypothetical protein